MEKPYENGDEVAFNGDSPTSYIVVEMEENPTYASGWGIKVTPLNKKTSVWDRCEGWWDSGWFRKI